MNFELEEATLAAGGLRNALEVLQDHWTQGISFDGNAYCSLGAINGQNSVYVAGLAREYLKRAIAANPIWWSHSFRPGDSLDMISIVAWNDHPNTTQDIVIDTFQQAIAMADDVEKLSLEGS